MRDIILKTGGGSLLHKNSKTTEIYTHVSAQSIGKIKSPLDILTLKKGGKEFQ